MVPHLKAGGEARGQAAEAAHGLHPAQHALDGHMMKLSNDLDIIMISY